MNTATGCLIGIELGTTRVKVGAYYENGTLIEEEVDSYPLFFERREGIAESDPYDWWNKTYKCLVKLLNSIKGIEIKGICVGSHGPSVVALDKHGEAVCNSILWMDKRASKEAEIISSKLGRKSNDLAWYVPRLLWLQNNKPEVYDRIKYAMQPLDYIVFRLTGEISASLASDHIMPWNREIIEASGISQDIFPDFTKMGETIGFICKSVCDQLGLNKSIPVIAGTGGADFVEVYISEAIIEKGIVCDRGGTSQGINLCWDQMLQSDYRFYKAPHPLVKDLYHVSGLMATTGKALQWYKELFYGKDVSYDRFFEDAARSIPGSKRLIFLPYLTGERTPWWDSKARGVFFGLSLEHEEKDIVRAILEGVGYGINHILRLFKAAGAEPTEIRACGGQARSPLWNQIKADITGLPVSTADIVDGATFGLAIIAGKGVGIYDNIVDASKQLVHISRTYEPDMKKYKFYSELQEIYEGLYPKLKDDYEKLASIKQVEN